MVIIYWTCGGVAKVAIIVIVRSQMDQTNHLAASRKFDFPGNLTSQIIRFPGIYHFLGKLTSQEI